MNFSPKCEKKDVPCTVAIFTQMLIETLITMLCIYYSGCTVHNLNSGKTILSVRYILNTSRFGLTFNRLCLYSFFQAGLLAGLLVP